MSKTVPSPAHAAVRTVVGSDDVIVRAVSDSPTEMRRFGARYFGADRILPVYYRAGTVAPRVGDRLPTWVDGTERYAMAVRP